jgi:hypothetical protein
VLDKGIVYTVGRCGKSILKLMCMHLMPVLASQSTLHFAELDTLFSSVANTVNQRPTAIKTFTEEDAHAITPNDLLLHRNKNSVPGVAYGTDDSATKGQEIFRELEQAWWDRWIVQALPHIVPVKEWKHEHRSMVVGDVVFVLYEKKTVTVGMEKTDKRAKTLPCVPRALMEIKQRKQRIAAICPVEEQVDSDYRVQEEVKRSETDVFS